MRQFQLGGFRVQLVGDHELYVSWIIPKNEKKQESRDSEDIEFPNLMNLKKMANKYRGSA